MKRFWLTLSAVIVFGLLMGFSTGEVFLEGNKIWAIGMIPGLGMMCYGLVMAIKGWYDFEKSRER